MTPRGRYDAVIVGAGISGLYLLHRLRELGLSALVVDQATGVGGTWFWNRYPGARCDIESMTYSYSWSHELEQEWTWSERYAAQPEILAYLEHVADRFDLRRDIRLGTRVRRGCAGGARGVLVDRHRGRRAPLGNLPDHGDGVPLGAADPRSPRPRAVRRRAAPHGPVAARGRGRRRQARRRDRHRLLRRPGHPDHRAASRAPDGVPADRELQRPGLERPARSGRRQPQRKERYGALRSLARTTSAGNPWNTSPQSIWEATPEEREREFEERYAVGGFCLHAAYRDIFQDPAANELLCEFLREKIRRRVHDPEVAELLCPYDHPVGTKRMCVDTGYFETYNRDNVRLVSIRDQPIDEISERGLRVGEEEFALDTIVLGTGFDAITGALLAIDLRGRDGQSLRDKWAAGPRSALGLTIAGFPNLFTVTGPGSPSVLSNMMVSIEQHVDWIVDCIAHLRAHGIATIEPTPRARGRVGGARPRGRRRESLSARRSWYMGANIPGKPRVLLPYVGGVGTYRELCDAVAERGYEGFLLR